MELNEYKKDLGKFFNEKVQGQESKVDKPTRQRKEEPSMEELAMQNKLPKRSREKGLDRDKEVEQYARNVKLLVDFAREKHK